MRIRLEPARAALVALSLIAGLLLVILVYGPGMFNDRTTDRSGSENPPSPSPLPFHLEFVSEEVCLNCHAHGKELPMFDLVAQGIPHEPREQCVGCHLLPPSDSDN